MMNFASKKLRLFLVLWMVLVGWGVPAAVRADANNDVAMADQLKTQAFADLKAGRFDAANVSLTRAAAVAPNDSKLVQMAGWVAQFEAQRKVFAAERQKEYEKAVADVHLLLNNHKESYATDVASRAYLLAADKQKFHDEPWVKQLIPSAAYMADEFEAAEQWTKALRLYSDLSAIEPDKAEWKDRLKLTTRRIRLLALYSPDVLRKIQESESREREEVEALLRPTTKPASKPTTQDKEAPAKIDWHDSLQGVRMDMLSDSLIDAKRNYYREVTLSQMAIGGLKGLAAVLTTKGLEKEFPGLADADKRKALLDSIETNMKVFKTAQPDEEEALVRGLLKDLDNVNTASVGLPKQVLVNEFADGAFAELDPFSNIIWPAELAEFEKSTQGEFSGVGIQIQSDDDGSLKVVSPLEDSPAFKAGIKAGDLITHINGKSAKGININQAVKLITGPRGTHVTLTVKSPSGTSKDYTLTRDTIKVASIKGWNHKLGGGWDYFIDRDQKIGYIRMTQFTRTTAKDLSDAIADMSKDGVRGIILDLRYNPGGLLNSATEICDKFIKDGVLVSTRPDRQTPNQPTVAKADPDKDKTDLPLVVLVNQYSASASEIVSGALKDHKRAMLVGERTFGKGSVQMLYQLGNNGEARLKLTTSHYYLPSGRCIHREENSKEWGVDPTVTIEMTPEQMRAAIDARQDSDILRDAGDGPTTRPGATTKSADPLNSDAQLLGALLLMRLQINGASL